MKVSIIGHTTKPVNAICTAIAIMKDEDPLGYVNRLTYPQKERMIKEILKSRLRGALEFATFEFLIENVTRAFTHQLVRHRTFHFSQQSMRFFNATKSGFKMPNVDSSHKELLKDSVKKVMDTYFTVIDHGCPIEDARSILPTNIQTKIMFGATMRGLIDLAEVRLCYQAQEEFKQVVSLIKNHVSNVNRFLGSLLMSACQRSGKCEFRSIYDRKCPVEKTLKEGK